MATTRMRVSNSAQVFHRVAASADMATHDVGTSDSDVSGLGGSGDFQIAANTTVTYPTAHAVFNSTESAMGGTADCGGFLHIKNTGFTSATKDTAVAADAYITVGLSDTFALGGSFKLMAGESITLHGLGDACDSLDNNQIDSNVAATYVEITYLGD